MNCSNTVLYHVKVEKIFLISSWISFLFDPSKHEKYVSISLRNEPAVYTMEPENTDEGIVYRETISRNIKKASWNIHKKLLNAYNYKPMADGKGHLLIFGHWSDTLFYRFFW